MIRDVFMIIFSIAIGASIGFFFRKIYDKTLGRNLMDDWLKQRGTDLTKEE